MEIRRFAPGDETQVSALIVMTLRITNSRDYAEAYLNDLIQRMQPEDVRKRADYTHFYVAVADGAIIGCGAIGPYWEKEDESSFFTIFVLPEWQGRGVGREIVSTLEGDEYALRAKRIEIPASITAVPFYLKLGYQFKNGRNVPDGEGLLRLEKYR